MIFESLPLIPLGLLAVAVFWCLPARYGQDGVAAFTAFSLLLMAPATAAVMLASIVLVQRAMVWSERMGGRAAITSGAVCLLAIVLLVSRELETYLGLRWMLIGPAYSTLRHIHVLAEWSYGRIGAPSLRSYFHYHLLLPVLVAGPIHRLPHFERQCQRRRWNESEFFSGAERALIGCALVIVVGEYLIGSKIQEMLTVAGSPGFGRAWLASAADWLRTYITLAGLTDIALGICLMMGLSLEENFNKPWQAHSLVQFWSRWHMTLTFWCRDYVYTPVAVWFRSPLTGIFAAMLVLGLWHETSLYYAIWGAYQAAGIALWHLFMRIRRPVAGTALSETLMAVVRPVAILAWVSSARPVILTLMGGVVS